MRAFGLACCTLAALMAIVALAFGAGNEVAVTNPETGDTEKVSLTSLGQDPTIDGDYTVRGPNGEQQVAITGYPLGDVLVEAGYDTRYGFEEAAVIRPNGSRITLTPEQIRNGSAEGPPAVWVDDEGTVGFIRPSEGPADLNSSDYFEAPGGQLQVEVEAPEDGIEVEIQPSATKVEAGEAVSFKVKVVAAPEAGALDYSWTFQGAASAAGAAPSRKWKRPGRYAVAVTATDSARGLSGDDGVLIEVGEPPKDRGDKDEDKKPDRSGGGADDDGSDSGAYEDGDQGSGSAPATSGDTSDQSRAGKTSEPAQPRSPKPREKEPAEPGSPEIPVEGELLGPAAAAPLPPEQSRSPLQSLRTGTAEDAREGTSLSDALLAGATVLGLLGLGAFMELGRPLRGRFPGGRMPRLRIPTIPKGPPAGRGGK